MEKTGKRELLFRTWKTQTLAAALAVIISVALPQVFHLVGMVSDLGSALGETFLPMHLSIFLVGYLAGAYAGFAAGLLSPFISFALTSAAGQAMPALPMLPYMMIELCIYGVVTGLFARFGRGKVPVILSLFIAQFAGRAVRALAIIIGYFGFGSSVAPSLIWSSIVAGLPGLILQWILVPLMIYYAEQKLQRK